MNKFLVSLFSIRSMTIGLFIFLTSIALATILESKYDIQTAKILIYNALWFELVLFYLAINLIINIVRYKMCVREKIAMLSFHLSFIVIIIGAGITRFFSYEGLMVIPEGKASNFIYTSDPHLWFKINDGKIQYTLNKKMFLSEQTANDISIDVDFPGRKPIEIEVIDFKKKQIDSLIIDEKINEGVLEIVTDGMKSNYIGPNNFVMIGEHALSYAKKNAMPGIEIQKMNGDLMIRSKLPLKFLPMAKMQQFRQTGKNPPDSAFNLIPSDTFLPFLSTTLYLIEDQQFVFKREIPHASMRKMSSGRKDKGLDIVTLLITSGKETKIVDLIGGIGQIPEKNVFRFAGLSFEMEYGSTKLDLPFSILCNDFQLDKYPGSEVASSFASNVTIIDEEKQFKKNQRIFMNHVMDYRGFRFFQSSYDLDDPKTPENEEGTRLSVNHDYWGTTITYIGYLLMSIGMIMSLFAPVGRFKDLLGKIKTSHEHRKLLKSVLILFFISFSSQIFAEEHSHDHNHGTEHATEKQKVFIHRFSSVDHSEEIASLLVQDYDGRIVPMHTMCDQLLRKIYGKNTYNEKNAVQMVMSLHMYPPYWLNQDIISVPQVLRERLKLNKYVSFDELTDHKTGEFKWMMKYNESHHKLESKRSEFDKKIIKLVERFQVLNSIFSWQYLKIVPLKNHVNNLWVTPFDEALVKKDTLAFRTAMGYLSALDKGAISNSFGFAYDQLNVLKKYQRKVSKKNVPSESLVNIEIRYNKMSIFKNSMYSYFCLGLILLIIYFVSVFTLPTDKTARIIKRISLPFILLMFIVFLYHGLGLGMRWYISGHAPWSNGYEAVIFIAWVSMIAGFVFSRQNKAVLAGTAILAFFILFVTELNLMDPEITPLQPVLKSYWLMIHVAVITGSYGFLGLGAILSLLNQFMYVFRTKNNGKRITTQINEITAISELTITLGLFMLTIGTFLGGIWANESWGRYWGWDPKETWALVSVLVYAIILHLRYIPGLNGKFTFNLVGLWGYSAIIFTFFGVNFYLVGLHSYAQGEGLAEIPSWIYYTIYSFALFSLISFLRVRKYKKITLTK